MAAYDFTVDLEALIAAAGRVARAVQVLDRGQLGDSAPAPHEVGHVQLANAWSIFHAQWSDGLGILRQDAQEVAGRLCRVAGIYAEFDTDTDPSSLAAFHRRFAALDEPLSGLR
jgi:hypothetical protein